MTAPAANTPYAIITDAMQDAGLLQDGDEPNSEQLAKYMRRLQDVITFEQTQGLKLFLLSDTSITLVATTQTYTVTVASVKPIRVDQGYILDSSSIRRPIYPLSWNEWLTLSNITQQGTINSYFVNIQPTALTVSFWYIPDTTQALSTAHLLVRREVTQPINLVETMEFPIEWRMFLRWSLADELCTGQPAAIVKRCEGKAEVYRQAIEAWDVEQSSTMFQVDSRGGMQSSFK